MLLIHDGFGMIRWIYFPRSDRPTKLARQIVQAFEANASEIDSGSKTLESNDVLKIVSQALAALDFRVEQGKSRSQKISVPVFFGLQGKPEKSFDADAFHSGEGFVVEVEAGRAVEGNQFLKDFFQACMMQGVSYLAIAVRNRYRKGDNFETVKTFFETLYASRRLQLPLKGVLLIGY